MNEVHSVASRGTGDAAETLKLLADSNVLKEAREEAAAQLLAKRKGLAAELRKLEREAEKEFPKLRTAVEAAAAEVHAAESVLDLAREKYRAAASAVSAGSFGHSRSRDELELELRATAAPEIDAFIRSAWEEWESLAKQASTSMEISRHRVTGRRREVGSSNTASINARRQALRHVIAAAEELKLEPIEPASIPARLAKLRDELPSVAFVDIDREA